MPSEDALTAACSCVPDPHAAVLGAAGHVAALGVPGEKGSMTSFPTWQCLSSHGTSPFTAQRSGTISPQLPEPKIQLLCKVALGPHDGQASLKPQCRHGRPSPLLATLSLLARLPTSLPDVKLLYIKQWRGPASNPWLLIHPRFVSLTHGGAPSSGP